MKLIITSAVCLAFIALTCAAMESNTIVLPEKHDSLESIRNTCFQLLDALDAQPVCNDDDDNLEYKVLSIGKHYYGELIGIVCAEAEQKLKQKNHSKCVLNVRPGSPVKDSNNELVFYGIQEHFYIKQPSISCSMKKLKKAFNYVINEMILNWKHSNLAEHPNILLTQDESQWSLLIKQTDIKDESDAFECILSLFKLNRKAHCWKWWLKESNNLIYFWIKQKHFEEVTQKLTLEVS